MEIHLGSSFIHPVIQSSRKDGGFVITCDSSIVQCADSDAKSCGCCQSILNVIIECFNAVLICLGLKEKMIDKLLKDPISFVKLLNPSVKVSNQDAAMLSEYIFYLLCDKEGQTIDLPDGQKFLIDHEIVKHVLKKEKSQGKSGFENWGRIKLNGMTLLHVARSKATASLFEKEALHLSFQIEY